MAPSSSPFQTDSAVCLIEVRLSLPQGHRPRTTDVTVTNE